MNKMIGLLASTVTAGLLTTGPAAADDALDLLAGQHTNIGEVRFCDDGADLFVVYDSTGARS